MRMSEVWTVATITRRRWLAPSSLTVTQGTVDEPNTPSVCVFTGTILLQRDVIYVP